MIMLYYLSRNVINTVLKVSACGHLWSIRSYQCGVHVAVSPSTQARSANTKIFPSAQGRTIGKPILHIMKVVQSLGL